MPPWIIRLYHRYQEITEVLSQSEIYSDKKKLEKYTKERARLSPVISLYKEIQKFQEEQEEYESIIHCSTDEELIAIANSELPATQDKLRQLQLQAKILLLPKDPREGKNIILEIRAGTGGGEATLFTGDLFKMYKKFAELNKWKFEIIKSYVTEIGGLREVIVNISGKTAYTYFQFEAGTHRVQRIPQTEARGRIHTSAITVAILTEPEDIELEINPLDIRIDTFRAQGAGGQHVNTTDSAVRITHFPTGLVISCQDERSQIKNKNKAMKYLKAKIYQFTLEQRQNEETQLRKKMVGSGDRSEKIRTYNYPQGRITDHRIHYTTHKLEEIMNTGNITEIVEKLIAHDENEKVQQFEPTEMINFEK